MKTLIVFGSTYGYTKDCVEKLSEKLSGDVIVVNVMTDPVPSLMPFEQVIIGGSIYMGQIQKKVKNFCIENEKELENKHIGLFLCCGLPENLDQNMKNAFPEKLLNKAMSKECFGGELRMKKMKFAHRILAQIMSKAASKDSKQPVQQLPENIEKLAKTMGAGILHQYNVSGGMKV